MAEYNGLIAVQYRGHTLPAGGGRLSEGGGDYQSEMGDIHGTLMEGSRIKNNGPGVISLSVMEGEIYKVRAQQGSRSSNGWEERGKRLTA